MKLNYEEILKKAAFFAIRIFAVTAVISAVSCRALPAAADDGKTDYQQGFPVSITGDIYGQIKVADIDRDGKNEMIFGASDGMVHIVGADGKEKRFGLWPKQTGGPILSSVAVSDKGKSKVIAGSLDGKVYCMDLYGKTEWTYDTKGNTAFSSPQLCEGPDGKLKTYIGSNSGRVVRLDDEGNVEWQTNVGAPVSAPVKVLDIDNKNKADVVVRDTSGKVSVYRDGQLKTNWPQSFGSNTGYWPFEVNVVDIDKDGRSEIISQTTLPYSVKVLDSDGNTKISQPLPAESHSQVRMVDIDKDGELDMVLTYTHADNKGAFIDVRNQKGQSLSGWPRKIGRYIKSVPQIADVDGDGEPDFIFTSFNDETKEKAGYVNVLTARGDQVPGFPKYIGKTYCTPTVADIDGDGRLDIIVAGGVGLTAPQLHVFKAPAAAPIKMLVLGTQYENY
ncbi:MAG: FG-GAP repeat protein [bacterium ADurb.Bin243]|nr:MAG: FG-GAP repeat protein [bacterium ADurb.Bin243]